MFTKLSNALSITVLALCCVVWLLFGLSISGWKALSIPTSSMSPEIKPGSLVLVHSVPISSLKVGDVITYNNPYKPGSTVSHKIVKKYLIDGKVPGFVTKGDANKLDDLPIAAGLVIGKIVWHTPHLGYILMDARKPIYLLPIIYIAAFLIFIDEAQRLSGYFKSLQPYRLAGYRAKEQISQWHRKLSTAGSVTALLLVTSAFFWQPALALLRSNTVSLVNNRITVAPSINKCHGNNNTNINISNNSTQTATTGNSKVTNNTSGGSATSGSASNSNTTSISVTVNNCP